MPVNRIVHPDDVDRADFNSITVKTLDNYAPGVGYDALKFNRAYKAIAPIDAHRGGRDDNFCTVWAALSARELIKEMQSEFDLRALYLGAEAGVSAKLLGTFKSSETAFTVVARQTIQVGVDTIVGATEKVDLIEDARDRLKNDLSSFHRTYGGYFCHSVVLGGEVYVAYQGTMTTRERAKEVSGQLSGSYKTLGSFMAEVSSKMKETSKHSRWQMTAHTLGAGGSLDDYDPEKPETVEAAVRKFLRDFAENVRKEPKSYFGQYDGYWRLFREAEPLKDELMALGDIVDALCGWATDYADLLASIHAFTDPDNQEGYHVDAASRDALEAMETEITDVWEELKKRYARMELFDDYIRPEEIEGVKDHPPSQYRKKVEAMRERFRKQLQHGQVVYLAFPDSGYQVKGTSWSLPAGATPPDNDAAEPLGAGWPYIRLSLTSADPYRIKPVGKKEGDMLCHGDTVQFVQTAEKDFDGHQVYMSVKAGIWTLGLAPYEGGRGNQYKWTVNIVGCRDTSRVITTGDTVWIGNVSDPSCFMCIYYTDYLCVTRSASDEHKIRLLNSPGG